MTACGGHESILPATVAPVYSRCVTHYTHTLWCSQLKVHHHDKDSGWARTTPLFTIPKGQERILTRRITLRTETGSSAASQGLLPERGGESTSKNGGASVGEHLHGAGDAEQPTGRPREVRGDASGGALSVPLGAYSLPSVLNNTTTFCAQRAPFKPPLHPSVGVQNLL